MILSVIFPSMLVILLSILSVIGHPICGNNLNWLLNLNLIHETLWNWGKKWLVDFNARKIKLFLFDQSKNNGATDEKIDRSILDEKSSFKRTLMQIKKFQYMFGFI